MLDFTGIITDADLLAKAFRGPNPHHKYISRKWNGERWEYQYHIEKFNIHNKVTDDPHTLDLPDESDKYGHEPKQAYLLANWIHKAKLLFFARRPQVLEDGDTQIILKIGKRAKKWKYTATDQNTGKITRFAATESLIRWLKKRAQKPIKKLGIDGELHHTLYHTNPSKNKATSSWMRAEFNPNHAFNLYGSAHQRVFRSRSEYEKWWHTQLEFQLGKRGESVVKLSAKNLQKRPMTSLLESGMIPWKPSLKNIRFPTSTKEHKRISWSLNTESVGITESEFIEGMVREHFGLLTDIANRYIAHQFNDRQAGAKTRIFNEVRHSALLGLLEAANRYNPSKVNPVTGRGYRFSSFAGTWMMGEARKQVKKELSLYQSDQPIENIKADLPNVDIKIDVHKIWWNKQKQSLEKKLDNVKNTELEPFIQKKYKEFLELHNAHYEEMQHWVADNMSLDYVIPIDDPETYGYSDTPNVDVAKLTSAWNQLLHSYFKQQRKGASQATVAYHSLAQKMLKDFAPYGNLRQPAKTFQELSVIHKDEIISVFGKDAATPYNSVEHVTRIFKKELPKLVQDSKISSHLAGISTNMEKVKKSLTELFKKSLFSIVSDQIKAVVVNLIKANSDLHNSAHSVPQNEYGENEYSYSKHRDEHKLLGDHIKHGWQVKASGKPDDSTLLPHGYGWKDTRVTAPHESKIRALEMDGPGSHKIVHRATRPGVKWQVSEISKHDGRPLGHTEHQSLQTAIDHHRGRMGDGSGITKVHYSIPDEAKGNLGKSILITDLGIEFPIAIVTS